MTIDELTKRALAAFHGATGTWNSHEEQVRAAVLAVLAEVRQCVPEEAPKRWHDSAHDEGNDDGWNDCRAEMLRRLDELEGK